MTERNGDGPHKTATVLPPLGKPFAPGHDPRRNAGGRPRGLAAMVRRAVGDGGDLVRFYRAVFDGDAKAIGERRPICLRDRILAGEWLASRGWGRAPIVIEPPDEPAGPFAPGHVKKSNSPITSWSRLSRRQSSTDGRGVPTNRGEWWERRRPRNGGASSAGGSPTAFDGGGSLTAGCSGQVRTVIGA